MQNIIQFSVLFTPYQGTNTKEVFVSDKIKKQQDQLILDFEKGYERLQKLEEKEKELERQFNEKTDLINKSMKKYSILFIVTIVIFIIGMTLYLFSSYHLDEKKAENRYQKTLEWHYVGDQILFDLLF